MLARHKNIFSKFSQVAHKSFKVHTLEPRLMISDSSHSRRARSLAPSTSSIAASTRSLASLTRSLAPSTCSLSGRARSLPRRARSFSHCPASSFFRASLSPDSVVTRPAESRRSAERRRETPSDGFSVASFPQRRQKLRTNISANCFSLSLSPTSILRRETGTSASTSAQWVGHARVESEMSQKKIPDGPD